MKNTFPIQCLSPSDTMLDEEDDPNAHGGSWSGSSEELHIQLGWIESACWYLTQQS